VDGNRVNVAALARGLIRAPFNSLREFLGKRMAVVASLFGAVCIGSGAWLVGLAFLGVACLLVICALAVQARAEASGRAEEERAESAARREAWRRLSVGRRALYAVGLVVVAAACVALRILVGRLWTT
jgi:Zn-dependent membrane protease YugP